MNHYRLAGYCSPDDFERFRRHKGRRCPMCRRLHHLRSGCG